MKQVATSVRSFGRANGGGWMHTTVRMVIALAVMACLLGTVAAQLDVDTAGGPLTLPEEVVDAFAAWQEAYAESLTEPTASVAFAPDLLGPDTASLTLRWEDGRTDVVLSPARYRTGPVLVHEIGVLLGLPEVGPGVMDPVLTADAPSVPTDEDLALLRDLFTYPPADLTRDGVVDFYDLAAFGAAYGSVGINLRADLTGDGRVDDADLAELREAYTFAPPSADPPAAANLTPTEGPAEPADGIDDTSTSEDAGRADGQGDAQDDAQDDADDDTEPNDAEPGDDVPDEAPAPPDEDDPDVS